MLKESLSRHLASLHKCCHFSCCSVILLLPLLIAPPQLHGRKLLLCLLRAILVQLVCLAVLSKRKHVVVDRLLPDELGLMI